MVEGWRKSSIGEIGRVVTGTTPSTTKPSFYGGDIPFVAPGDLGRGLYVNASERTLTPEGLEQAKPLPVGAVLFTCIGATIGKSGIAGRQLATNQQINAVICDPDKADPEFVYYLLALRAESIKRIAGAQAVPIVNKSTFEHVTASFPPLPEQRKIAEILRTWDDAIELCERLRDAKARALIAARQKVFSRDGTPPSRWPSKALDTLVERIRRQSDGGEHPVMTISGKNGFIRQDEKFDRFMAGESVDRYLLLKRGEFAYNKGNSKTYPQGCIYRLEQDTALVPFVYFAFALRDGLNADFYAHLFEAGFLNHQLSRLINSGVRNDGLLNIYAEDFFSCVVPVPPEAEQTRIAAFFNLAKEELTALDRHIEAMRQQKRGLMQKLLTGEWRVKVDTEAAV